MKTIQIKTTPLDDAYPIHIEQGLLAQTGDLIRAIVPTTSAIVISDRNVTVTHGAVVCQSLGKAGYDVTIHEMEASEKNKTLQTIRTIHDAMFKAKLERKSLLVAVGGGIVGDTAGFAAATFLRGISLVHVPTTLLAMVDASIGGKTGVNYPLPNANAMGKNLIGSFWPPRLVLTDPVTLTTLEPRDFRGGLAECVKHGVLADADLLDWLEQHVDAILGLDLKVLTSLIERSASIKAEVVSEDVRELGRRALLNLGHTYAHAMESMSQLGLQHGEAVSIGLHGAMKAAMLTNRIEEGDVTKVVTLLDRFGLPTRLDSDVDIDQLMVAMTYDKKVEEGRLRLILPMRLGEATIVDDVPQSVIRESWQAILVP
ncbi:MAG: 3-dehydroquinate synthase [Planctomycetota bacterium]|nr:3-dehydroquinate synthase [Planctomycetota bacterium]